MRNKNVSDLWDVLLVPSSVGPSVFVSGQEWQFAEVPCKTCVSTEEAGVCGHVRPPRNAVRSVVGNVVG